MTDRFWKKHFLYWIFLIASLFIGIFAWMTSRKLQYQERLPYLVGIISQTHFNEYELPRGTKIKRMVPHRDFFFQLEDQPTKLFRLNELKASAWKSFEKEIKHKHAMRLQYAEVILEGEKQYITVVNAENEHWQLKDMAFRRKFFMWVTGIAGAVFVWLLLLLRKDYKTIKGYVGIESVHRSYHSETHNTGDRY